MKSRHDAAVLPARSPAPVTRSPLTFQPVLKRLIWGGRRLGTVLDKPIGPEPDYAESWEVADHRHGRSVVDDGPQAGRTLQEVVRSLGPELLGASHGHLEQFPLLFKFIDAREALSVQVHPDDARARRLADDNGKTEAWVVLRAEPGALIYAGLRPGVDRPAFEAALAAGTIEAALHRFPARAGDCVFIPAGTVHAIGAGVLMAEIQQMSDATFRIHDWGRLGADGRPRELHLDQALEVIDFAAGPVDPVEPRLVSRAATGVGSIEELVCCADFHLGRINLGARSAAQVGRASSAVIVSAIEGSARLVLDQARSLRLGRGQTALLPAGLVCMARAEDEGATLLACSLPT